MLKSIISLKTFKLKIIEEHISKVINYMKSTIVCIFSINIQWKLHNAHALFFFIQYNNYVLANSCYLNIYIINLEITY